MRVAGSFLSANVMGPFMLSNSYPMLQFNLGDEINMMRDSLRRFVDTELAPRADEIDRTDTFRANYGPRWAKWVCTG